MVSLRRRQIRSPVSKRNTRSTLLMPKQGRNACIPEEPQVLKTSGKRAQEPEENPMMKEADFTDFFVLVDTVIDLAERRAHEERRGRKSREILLQNTNPPVSEFFVEEEGESSGLYFLGESDLLAAPKTSSTHSEPQVVSKSEGSGYFQIYTTGSGVQYIGTKQRGKFIVNDIGSSAQPVLLQESPENSLEHNGTGADSMVTGKIISPDSVEPGRNTGAYLSKKRKGKGRKEIPYAVKLGIVGITFYKRIGRWTSHIWVEKQLYIGSYPTITEAARAYDKASLKHFNTAANLNYTRIEYALDIKEMAELTPKEYMDHLKRQAKLSKRVIVAEGVTRCPAGWFEVKIKEKAPPREWRFLGRFDNLEDGKRCYLMESKTTSGYE